MPFEPLNKDHSIASLSVAIKLDSQLVEADVAALDNAHGALKDDLPAKRNIDPLTAVVRQLGIPNAPLQIGSGISFSAMMRDGTPEWETIAFLDQIAVTCRRYTRWGFVRPRIMTFMRAMIGALPAARRRSMVGVHGTTVDEFRWRGGQEDYDLRELLAPSSDLVNGAVFARGPDFHLYQGWFGEVPNVGRLLTQVNIDGLRQPGEGQPLVRITSNRILTLAGSAALPDAVAGGDLERWSDDLHERDKQTLRSLLTASAQDQIRLNAPPVAVEAR